jgi:hypothetical protein
MPCVQQVTRQTREETQSQPTRSSRDRHRAKAEFDLMMAKSTNYCLHCSYIIPDIQQLNTPLI